MGQRAELRRLIAVVEADTGLRTPIRPETLAAVLGITLLPIAGARFTLRGDAITYDPLLPEVESAPMIARGCATHVLQRAGLLKLTELTIFDVAQALCGPAPVRLLNAAND
jgi:hypothetical protein